MLKGTNGKLHVDHQRRSEEGLGGALGDKNAEEVKVSRGRKQTTCTPGEFFKEESVVRRCTIGRGTFQGSIHGTVIVPHAVSQAPREKPGYYWGCGGVVR